MADQSARHFLYYNIKAEAERNQKEWIPERTASKGTIPLIFQAKAEILKKARDIKQAELNKSTHWYVFLI